MSYVDVVPKGVTDVVVAQEIFDPGTRRIELDRWLTALG